MVIGGCLYLKWVWLCVWLLLEEWLLVGGVIDSGCGYFLWVWLLLVYVWQLLEEWLLVGGVISYGCGYCWYMCSNCLRNGNWWVGLLIVGLWVWLLLVYVWQLLEEW